MGLEEGTSNGYGTDGVRQCLGTEAANNWSWGRVGNDGVDGFSGTTEGFQTYKRRKRTQSYSEGKGREDRRGTVEAASKLKNQTTNEPCHQFPASTNGSNVVSRQWRDSVLVDMYQSLIGEEGSLSKCILDSLLMPSKESVVHVEDGQKSFKQAEWKPKNSHKRAKHREGVLTDGALDESCYHSATEMCCRVFLGVILSEKFTLLCKLIRENFEGVKADNFFSLHLVNRRMKERAYECSPVLFYADIQQMWTKLEDFGNQLISLAKSLKEVSKTCYDGEVSKTCYDGEVGGSGPCAPEDGVFFVGTTQEAESCGKSEEHFAGFEGCTCRACGGKADGKDYLVCDSCEEMYHISCLESTPLVIPPISWYCNNCISREMGSHHANCAVCKRLDGCGIDFNQANDKISPMHDKFIKDRTATTYGMVLGHGSPKKRKRLGVCGVCKNVLREGDTIKKCDYRYCHLGLYHEKCLSAKQLKSCGPDWFCPSCLCRICLSERKQEEIILCDSCSHGYHVGCLNPPLTVIPLDKWHCDHCLVKVKEINRAMKAYKRHQKKSRPQMPQPKVDKGWKKCIDKKQNLMCEKELDKGRERMDILLNAALNY
ncbi:hypothetical protein K2173_022967 [Erythroxylum novogranatense]|uniref:PHD-type domain-containing protein n=1 Tax=Erythroxylum novogranatense TaxID=1862640 RepID=A0AAV8T896_9ROSI|nr:hypothetical protein K2173_022967 [Erythroxylum novogranatense]